MKKMTNVIIFIFSLIAVCFFVKDMNMGANQRLLGDASIILVFFLPRIFSKIFKFKISDGLELCYILFIIFAQFIGSIINLYNTTWWYDLLAHFISGIVTTILALVILNWFKRYDKKNMLFNITYMIMFTLMIASLWEFIEYGADIFLNMNVQHSIDTGVSDTMEDMLIAFVGSILVVLTYISNNKFIEKIVNALK